MDGETDAVFQLQQEQMVTTRTSMCVSQTPSIHCLCARMIMTGIAAHTRISKCCSIQLCGLPCPVSRAH